MKSKGRFAGQQLIEYLMLFVIVIVVFIVFLAPNGPLRRAVNQALVITIDKINVEANKLSD